jgi:hypothetical protein
MMLRFFTPNQKDYMKECALNAGLDQQIDPSRISFNLNYLVAFELTKSVNDYSPLVISLNYTDKG